MVLHRLLLLYRTPVQLPMQIRQKIEKQKFELEQWPQVSRMKPVLGTNYSSSSMRVAIPLESPCASSLAARLPKQNERSFSPRESRHEKAIRRLHVQKPNEDCKVGPEDWLVQNFERSKDSGFVNYQIHQTAVNMPHHPTKSDVDDFVIWGFIDREAAHANQRNQLHQADSSAKKNRSRKRVRTRESSGCKC